MKTFQQGVLDPADSPMVTAPVEVEDYDEYWPSIFRREKIRLLAAVGSWVVSIEHIGGTAVPGCSSRPVVDIVAGVRTIADADTFCLVALQKLGYRSEPEGQKLLPNARLFIRGSQMSRRCIRLWVMEKGDTLWHQFLGWRDYLRSHPEAAAAYGDHKRSLAAALADRNAYDHAKYAYIDETQRSLG